MPADAPEKPLLDPARYAAVHRALLAGLLSNVGMRDKDHEYAGARQKRFHIFPGSGLFKSSPQWVMAGELAQTTRLYARTVARIDPRWLENVGERLLQRSYSDPHYQAEHGHIRAYEKVTLLGLVIVPRRPVHYGPIDPVASRALFIQKALVEGELQSSAPFARHNRQLIESVRFLEARLRRRDLLVDDTRLFAFYDARIPPGIHNAPLFEQWRRTAERQNSRALFMSRTDIMLEPALTTTPDRFPDHVDLGFGRLPLEYRLDPGHPDDGVTLTVRLDALNHLTIPLFDWLVPGMLQEKLAAMVRSLPKALRTQFVPAPDIAHAAAAKLKPGNTPLAESFARHLSGLAKADVRAEDFDLSALPPHLLMNFRVIDSAGRAVASGRDLSALMKQLGVAARQTFAAQPDPRFHKDDLIRWDFGDLPGRVEIRRGTLTLQGFPALVDRGAAVSLRLFDSADASRENHARGVRRLFLIQLGPQLRQLERAIPELSTMALYYAPLGPADVLKRDLVGLIVDRAMPDWAAIRTFDAFTARAGDAWRHLSGAAAEVAPLALQAMRLYHELSLALAKPFAPLQMDAVRDVKDQLAHLIRPHFLVETPPDNLTHLPRYLRAVQVRLAKLRDAGLSRDNRSLATLAPYWRLFKEKAAKQAPSAPPDPELISFRWMVEEFRVSLFAQELGTAFPISPQKLDAQLARLRR